MSMGYRSPLWLLGIAVPSQASQVEAVVVPVARVGLSGMQLAIAPAASHQGALFSASPAVGHASSVRPPTPAPIGHSAWQRSASPLVGHRGRLHD